MRKLRPIFFVLSALIVLAVFFLKFSFEVYNDPKITLITPLANDYQPLVANNEYVFCYEAKFRQPYYFPNEFGVLVWNMHKGIDKNWQSEIKKLTKPTALALLQEVRSGQQLPQRLEDRFSYSLYASAYAFFGEESGVNILSSVPAYNYCAGSEEEPWIRIPKVGVSSLYRLENGQSLLVVNVHLVNFEWLPTNYQRQLDEIFSVVSTHQGPIIFAGDFNTWNKNRLALVDMLAARYGLTEVDYQPDVRSRFLGNPLDHVFVRDIEVLESTVIETSVSDHNPLQLKLRIK